jgi:hypothetical protein
VFGILCFVGQGKTFHGFYRNEITGTDIITPAVKYLQVVIPRACPFAGRGRESRRILDAGSKPAPDLIRGPA